MGRNKLVVVAVTLSAALGAAAGEANGQTVHDAGESYSRSRDILDGVLAAMGGRGAIGAINATEFNYTADVMARGQSADPNRPFDRQRLEARVLYEEGGRFLLSTNTVRRGGARFRATRVVDADSGFFLNEGYNTLTRLTPLERNVIVGTPGGYAPTLVPASLLRSAVANVSSLRWIGERRVNGRREQLIGFALPEGTYVTLSVDADNRLPSGVETVVSDPLLGDVVNAVRYGDYRSTGGIQFPRRFDFLLDGDTLATWNVTEVTINPTIDSASFAPPPGLEFSEPRRAFSPTAVADRLWVMPVFIGLGTSYNILIAEFDDYVAVVEAPLSDVIYRFVSGIIRATVGDKPIRYLVSTHYHQDHTGGVRAYVAGGVTLLTGPATAGMVERMAQVNTTMAPNPLSGVTPAIETVTASRTIRNGLEMRLIPVGPTPHVDELLLVYFPASRVLYTGDHFASPEHGDYGEANESLLYLARKIDALGLDVETFVPTHGPPASAVDFARAVGRTDN